MFSDVLLRFSDFFEELLSNDGKAVKYVQFPVFVLKLWLA